MIEIIREREHYAIYMDGEFRCSCDSMAEVTEELEEYEQNQVHHQATGRTGRA